MKSNLNSFTMREKYRKEKGECDQETETMYSFLKLQ